MTTRTEQKALDATFFVSRWDSGATLTRCRTHLADSEPWLIARAARTTDLVVCEVCGKTNEVQR